MFFFSLYFNKKFSVKLQFTTYAKLISYFWKTKQANKQTKTQKTL